MLKAKSGEKRQSPDVYIYIIWFFPNFSKSGRQILTKFCTVQERPRGRLWTKLGENLIRKIFLIDPRIFTKIFDPQYLRKGGRYLHALFTSG